MSTDLAAARAMAEIQDALSGMPPEHRVAFERIKRELHAIAKIHGDVGQAAVLVLAAEYASKD